MPFYKLEYETMKRTDLTLEEKVLLAVLDHMQGDKADAWPSQKKLGQLLSCSVSTVARIANALETKGEIKKTRVGFNRTNRYSMDTSNRPHGPVKLEGHTSQIDVSMPSNRPIHEEIYVIDPPTRPASAGVGGSWMVGWTEFFREDAEYDWADWKDARPVADLEAFLALGHATKDETNEELGKVWDEYKKKNGDIKSIPAVLLFRLKEKYGR